MTQAAEQLESSRLIAEENAIQAYINEGREKVREESARLDMMPRTLERRRIERRYGAFKPIASFRSLERGQGERRSGGTLRDAIRFRDGQGETA